MNKINYILPLALLLFCASCEAQQRNHTVVFKVNTETGKKPISPYIYGVNDFKFPVQALAELNIPNRRLGGGNFSTYNWENNFITLSPPGTTAKDFENSDIYVKDLPPEQQRQPAVLITKFHNDNLANRMESLITIPMMGYLPKDSRGHLNENERPPSDRFAKIKPFKGSALLLNPNTNDDYVFIDEMVHFLVSKYGSAQTNRGIKFYDLDNEPEYWAFGHKFLHPEKPTGTELITKSVETAKAIKSQDPHATVFALSYGGLRAHWNFQKDPDFARVSSQYPTYTAWFLKAMKEASNKAGYNLIDVVDMHYYSVAQGTAANGMPETVDVGSNDKDVEIARVRAPLSLWDSTAVEKSVYESEYNGRPLNVIQNLQHNINDYFPGLKLAFSEYNFGGWNDISGAIAEADFLGIAAKYGVFWASLWNTCPGKNSLPAYQLAAIKLYRNYDGKFSTFGNTYVNSRNEIDGKLDPGSSVYASYSEKNKLHLIAINKDYSNPIEGEFNIKSTVKYTRATVWALTNKTNKIIALAPVDKIVNNTFKYSIPPLSVIHIVLEGQ